MFWICTLNDFFLIIYHLDWPSHSVSCTKLSRSFRHVLKERLLLSGSGGESYWGADWRSGDLKRLSGRNWCTGAAGGILHVSIRMHAFPCESISKAAVHYQHNGPADGDSCHTRLLASEEHCRQAALLRGRPRESHRSGQGTQGLYELLTGSYLNFPRHNCHFYSL